MADTLNIPTHARGTMRIGDTTYHYERSHTGALMLVPGPDTRDWQAIDRGVLDYSQIASQEHAMAGDGFTAHDGPRIAAACPICNHPDAALAANATRDPDAALRSLAAQGNTEAAAALARRGLTPTTPPPAAPPADVTLTPEQQAAVEARNEARLAEQRAAELQAQLDNIQKQTLPPVDVPTPSGVTGAADPDKNAGIPPTDPDVVAGAAPDVQAQTVAALAASDTVNTGPLGQALVAAQMRREAEASVRLDGETHTVNGPPYEGDTLVGGPDHAAALTEPPNTTPEGTRPETGIDPWTKQAVPIYWKIPGASPTHPYGAKKDGSPRRPVGRKQGS